MNPSPELSASRFPIIEIMVHPGTPAVRHREPVTCGIPWPKGRLPDPNYLVLRDEKGDSVPLQTRVLDRWSDGSVRWLLLDWQATVDGDTKLRLEIGDFLPAMPTAGALRVQQENKTLKGRTFNQGAIVDTGFGKFRLRKGLESLFEPVDLPGSENARRILTICSIQHDLGHARPPLIWDVQLLEQGPLRSCVRVQGGIYHRPPMPFAFFEAYLYFFSRSATVRILFSISNPKAAKHSGGIWSLGDKRSIFFKDVSFALKWSEFTTRIEQLEEEKKPAQAAKEFGQLTRLNLETNRLFWMDRDMTREWASPGAFRCSPERQIPFAECLEIYQDSSGGPNWQSSNHLNRHSEVASLFCGYRLRSGGMLSPPQAHGQPSVGLETGGESMVPSQEQTGRRATPIVILERDGQTIGLAMRHFWQNFPKAIEAGPHSLTLRLFPRQYADLHELQGGEQKTHEFVVAFGKDTVTPDQPLEWVRSPLRVRVDPAWYAASGVVPYLTPEADDPNTDYIKLIRAAIEGDDTFEKKREVIDEYGWRNFGDIYADHEAVPIETASGVSDSSRTRESSEGSLTTSATASTRTARPLVSHYNNQYDPLAGFAIQFMRSGDGRWWEAMNQLAAHVVDIDIYHTDQDKSAYNHGLFWHTVHYTDAGLSTHRSYPRGNGTPSAPTTLGAMLTRLGSLWKRNSHQTGRERMAPQRSSGGGPGNEHNYTTGLMLHYFLTGNPQSREAAIGLAQWVIDMDDGSKTIFRWLDRGYTGLASATVSPDYHGPGRGAGNSINALIDGHRLAAGAGDPGRAQIFLEKAEQLIRRCIHPADDIAARNLLDAERRWSYPVFLQALGKYLDYKIEREELDRMYAYARAALLHYARWMADHEYPYLEKPEILEFPTETWVAQDMRKSEVFKFAAKHAAGDERARFLERSEFFFRYVTTTLLGMKTRTLARPVVILLSNGFMHAYFQKHPEVAAPSPLVNPTDFGRPEIFVPQKVRAKRRFVILGAIVAAVGVLAFLFWLLGM